MLSFKVSQSALTLSVMPAKPVLYQSQTMPLTVSIALTKPTGAMLQDIVLGDKSDKTFLRAMGSGEMGVVISEDGRSAKLSFDLEDASMLASGKSYTLYLDVTARGSAADAKTTQLKLTIQVK